MPVLQNGDDFRRHDNEDYSFVTRSDRSRDYARRRRFGNEEDDDHVMSQVSLPLRLSRLGTSSRRSYSPMEDYSPSRRSVIMGTTTPYSERGSKLSGPVRQALALSGEIDRASRASEPFYGSRSSMPLPQQYDDIDDDDEYVIVMQRRRKRDPMRRIVREEEYALETPQRSRHPSLYDDDDDELVFTRQEQQQPRKREYNNDATMTYTMPVSRRRHDGILEEEEPVIREVAAYVATRKQFAAEDDDVIQKLKNQKYQYRTRGLNRLPSDTDEDSFDRKGSYAQAPMFIMKLRSHVVWEKMYVKFTCTIRGTPEPKVTWYHNLIAIEPTTLRPGTMKIMSQFGVHTLEIFQAGLEDSGTYRVSAQNHKGEISSYATLVVRRYDGVKSGYYDCKTGYNLTRPTDFPDVEKLDIPGYPRFISSLFNKKVFEGEAVTMTCHIDGKPNPEVFWTLNGRNLDDKIKHIQVDFDGTIASLTILHAYCDDEGEYICRAYNSCGAATSHCFLSVTGSNAPPSAPTGVQCSGVTRNYLIISWKPPGYTGHFGGAPILGYFVEIAVAGSSVWKQANKHPFKLTRTPISCVEEGQAYFFRVRAYSRWGHGPASLPVGPVAMRDSRTPRHALELAEPGTVLPPAMDDITFEEEESTGLPGIPYDVKASLTPSGDNVLVSWVAPSSDNLNGYFIEYCDVDNEEWIRVNDKALEGCNPYPVTGLQQDKCYRFRVRSSNQLGESYPSDCTENLLVTAKEEVDIEQTTSQKQSEESMHENKDEQHRDGRYRGAPTPPRDVQCLLAKREYIEVGWIPPAHSGGDPVRYHIEYRKLGTDSWHTVNQTPIVYTQYPVGELDEGESYMFRVRCVNKYGTSVFSEPSEPILASDGIKPPNWWGGMQGLFKVAEDKGKPCVTQTSIKVCWDIPTTDGGSNITGYYLEYRPCGGKFRPVNNKPITQRHFTVDGLNPGEFYEFRIKACNEVGSGEWKNMPGRVQARDLERPSEPTDVTITNLSEENVSLSWRKPEKMGDGEFVGYIVERRKEGIDFWIPCNKIPEEIKDEKYTSSGLVPGYSYTAAHLALSRGTPVAEHCARRIYNIFFTGQTYFFRVRAVNQLGEGENSLQSCYVTMGEPLDDVRDRQNAIVELKRKKEEEKRERLRLLEEEERKEAFLTNIEDCYATKGGQARFECKVKDRRTKVAWYIGNWKEVTIKPQGKYDIICSGKRRSLLVNNCCEEDVQAIHCVALYNGCSCVADLVVDDMVPVRFIRLPSDVYITKGERAVFDCVLSKPTAKVTWKKFDDVITADDESRYEFINQGCGRSLLINDVIPEDIALYTIKGLGGSFTVNLVVDGVLPVKFDKEITSESLPHTATLVVFECVANPSPLYGDRIPPCQWYHNDELIEESDEKYELIWNGNTHILKILNPTYEDNGSMKCIVGGGKTLCDIYVEKPPPPPPKLEKSEDYIINFEQGLKPEALSNALRLYCVVSNLHEDASIIWYQDDVEIGQDRENYKIFSNSDTGLVSLVISPILDELERSKFTCEFITPHSTFDTKVNFEFEGDEFKKVCKKANSLQEEEEAQRKARKQEREKKRLERRSKEKTPITSPDLSQLSVPGGIVYDVTSNGLLQITAQANLPLLQCDVTWLKDSSPVQDERISQSKEDNTAMLCIENLCSSDAATYTCQIKMGDAMCEASSDFTGKIFKELLLKSAEIRIQPLADCEAMINNDVIKDVAITSEQIAVSENVEQTDKDIDQEIHQVAESLSVESHEPKRDETTTQQQQQQPSEFEDSDAALSVDIDEFDEDDENQDVLEFDSHSEDEQI